MLSIEDIYREIGRNIFICPLNIDNFRDNSIDLTASEFAWTSDGNNIYDEESDRITVPPHMTACILTKESIYVSEKIGGTYHSRVSLVKKGFGHIGTMLDPKYCGQSLIMLHNISDNDLILENIKTSPNGVRIVSLVFYYVKTPIYENSLSTPPSHQDKIGRIDAEGRYAEWISRNPWVNNAKNLKAHFREKYEKEFKKKRKYYAQKQNFISRLRYTKFGPYILKYGFMLILGGVTVFIVRTFFKQVQSTDWAAISAAYFICLINIIMSDIHLF